MFLIFMVVWYELQEADALKKCDPETVQDQQQETEVIIYAWGPRPPKDLGAPSQLLNHDRLTTITWGNTHPNTHTHIHTHTHTPIRVEICTHTDEMRTCAYRHAAETVEAVSFVPSDTVVTEHYSTQVWPILTAQLTCATKPRHKKHSRKEKSMFWLKTPTNSAVDVLTSSKKKFLLHQTLQEIVSSETSGACSWFAETSTAKILSWRLCWVACNAPAYMHMTIRDNSMIKSTSCNRFCFHLRNADEQRGHYTAMESFIVSNHTFSHWYMS